MALFPVPKFIESETKIVGPLAFRQVIFVLITVVVSLLVIKILPPSFAYLAVFGVAVFGFSLAFLKIKDIPFSQFVAEGIGFLFTQRKFAWGMKGREGTYTFKEIVIEKEKKNNQRVKKGGLLEKTIVKVKTKK